MICRHCGANIPDDQLICPECGAEVQMVPDYNPLDDVLTREVKGSVEGATRQIQTDDIRRYRRDGRTQNVNATRVLGQTEMHRIRQEYRDGAPRANGGGRRRNTGEMHARSDIRNSGRIDSRGENRGTGRMDGRAAGKPSGGQRRNSLDDAQRQRRNSLDDSAGRNGWRRQRRSAGI